MTASDPSRRFLPLAKAPPRQSEASRAVKEHVVYPQQKLDLPDPSARSCLVSTLENHNPVQKRKENHNRSYKMIQKRDPSQLRVGR